MFDTGNIRYLLTLSDGIQVNVYFREGLGICLATTDRRKRWSPEKTVVRASLPYFSTSADKNDGIHIFHQDLRGDLVHLLYTGQQWEKSVVLKGKEPSQYDKHPYITCLGDTAYLFYTLKYSGNCMMSVQRIEADGRISTPVALDYIENASLPYKVFCDGKEIYLAYCRIRDDEKQYICRSYDFNNEGWKETAATTANPVVYALEAIAVHKGEIHMCLSKKSRSMTVLFDYTYNVRNGSPISESTICEIQSDISTAFISVAKERLLCFWCDITKLRIYYSVNEGTGWSKPKSLSMLDSVPFYCFSISGGNFDFASQFNIIPGQYSNGIKLALADKPQMPYRGGGFSDEAERQYEAYSEDEQRKSGGRPVPDNYDDGGRIEGLKRIVENNARELSELKSDVERIKSMLW